MKKRIKILVTGGGGFIGSRLLPMLSKAGYEPVALVRHGSNTDPLRKMGIEMLEDPGTSQSLADCLARMKISGIIHLASCFRAEHCSGDVSELAESNLVFSLRLLDAAASSRVRWFINTGTVWQHFNNATYSPMNLYAATKQAFMDLARYYVENTDLNFATIELADTFGEDDPRRKIVGLWIENARVGGTLEMSPGGQMISLTYVENVCEAFLRLAGIMDKDTKRVFSGKVFRAAGRSMTLRKLASAFEDATGAKLSIKWGARPYRRKETFVPFTRGIPVPGWKERISLGEGLRRLCAHSGLCASKKVLPRRCSK